MAITCGSFCFNLLRQAIHLQPGRHSVEFGAGLVMVGFALGHVAGGCDSGLGCSLVEGSVGLGVAPPDMRSVTTGRQGTLRNNARRS